MAEKDFVERYRPHAEPLDDDFYHLGAEEAVFFKSWTGINDDDKLKEHILAVQRGAYEASALDHSLEKDHSSACPIQQAKPYTCIRWFTFAEWVILFAVHVCWPVLFMASTDYRYPNCPLTNSS